MIAKTSEVDFDGIDDIMIVGLHVFERVYQDFFPTREIVITATTNGQHMEESLHYQGLAADIRANDIPIETAILILERAKKYLDKDFDIILHGEGSNIHYHCEYDPH